MNDFDYDVKQKTRIARGARAKVNGSHSKQCTLSQDRMSNAEIAKRHGEVKTYNLSGPMEYKVFQAMPIDLRREYLDDLYNKRQFSGQLIADALGCSYKTFKLQMNLLGLPMRTRGGHPRAGVLEAYDRWLLGKGAPAKEEPMTEYLENPEPKETEEEVPLLRAHDYPALTQGDPFMSSFYDQSPAAAAKPPAVTGHFQFTGTADELYTMAAALMGSGQYEISIFFTPTKEDCVCKSCGEN